MDAFSWMATQRPSHVSAKGLALAWSRVYRRNAVSKASISDRYCARPYGTREDDLVTNVPRVAFFTDSFHEINGVALTSRQLDVYARERGLPMFSVHAGPETGLTTNGSNCTLELKRTRASIALDRGDLAFDPFFARQLRRIKLDLQKFRPDLVHVTGPGDIGILGAWLARRLRIPLVASWHTNLHEFAARRLEKLLDSFPAKTASHIGNFAERRSLQIILFFYKRASVVLAPNQELIDVLQSSTGRPTFLMERGVETDIFSPLRRDCPTDGPFVLGFVGRIQAEKNVRFLATLEQALISAGKRNFRFLIVGEGGERDWLKRHLLQADFPGQLIGEPLARAYANMDLFVFPSLTDTFGNVIFEAQASGVPAVVTSSGGPKFLVKSGLTGFIAADESSFIESVLRVVNDPALHCRMREAAREQALRRSWPEVFEKVYSIYRYSLHQLTLCSSSCVSLPQSR